MAKKKIELEFRTGKREAQHDSPALKLASVLDLEAITAPDAYDVDKQFPEIGANEIPMFLNNRFRYGTWARTGGPNSLRPWAIVFRPPSSTVPPSGTATVVWAEISVSDGCW